MAEQTGLIVVEQDALHMVEDLGWTLEHLDWSFGLVLLAVIVLAAFLIARHRKAARRQRRADKRGRRKVYKDWLQASGLAPPAREPRQDKSR